MCPKLDMKKIENPTKCQVAFSKRRSSLFRKTHEISVLCDVDLALIAFSPSGRLNKFCSQKRVEDVMQRYIDLPPDKRFRHFKNIEKTQEMLSQLDHLKDEESKMHYIKNQISLTELKLKKSKIEHEILEANLRDYEPEPERDPSLAQLLWCEKNLKTSLQRVMDKKRTLLGNLASPHGDFRVSGHDQAKQMVGISSQVLAPISCDSSQNELNFATQNPAFSHLIMQQYPLISPYRSKVRERILKNLEEQAKGISVGYGQIGAPNFTMTGLPSVYQSGLPFTTPETYVPPGYTHALTQPSAIINNQVNPIIPNQPLGVLDSTSMERFGHEIPFGVQVQQYLTQTVDPHLNNLDWQNSLAPMTWLNENPNEVNQVIYGNSNSSQNMNVNLPLTSEGVLSPPGYEPFFSNTVATSSYSSSNNNNNNNNSKNCACDANEKLLGSPSQVLPLPGSSKDLQLPIDISNEGMMGYESNGTLMNNAPNKVDGSWEWDDLVLAKNYNLEDLDDLL